MPEADISFLQLPPGELKPYAKNQRVHPKRQLKQLAASIRAHGFVGAVVVDEANVIIAGHGRVLAAKEVGLELVPVIRAAGLTDAQVRGLRIADNKIAEGAAWDLDLLREEIDKLRFDELPFGPDALGFATGEIDRLLHTPLPAGLEIVPAAPVTPASRLGDIWLLGPHRVGCGDGRDVDFLRKTAGPGAIDAAFLDPPYNVRIGGHAVAKGRHREFAMASGEMSRQAFTAFLRESLGAAAEVSKSGAVHFVCMDHRHADELADAGGGVYDRRLNICVWVKTNPGMGALYRSQHEFVFVYAVGSAQPFNAVELGRHGRNRTNVWSYAGVNSLQGGRRLDLELHPTVKPIALAADAICDVTRRDERVLDSFLGSGTTLLACERVGRRCVGVELDPAYVDLAIGRWRDMVGREPMLESTGQSFAQVTAARKPGR